MGQPKQKHKFLKSNSSRLERITSERSGWSAATNDREKTISLLVSSSSSNYIDITMQVSPSSLDLAARFADSFWQDLTKKRILSACFFFATTASFFESQVFSSSSDLRESLLKVSCSHSMRAEKTSSGKLFYFYFQLL